MDKITKQTNVPKAHNLTSPTAEYKIVAKKVTGNKLVNATDTRKPTSKELSHNDYLDSIRLSEKDRQMVASNWLLNKELRSKLIVRNLTLELGAFRNLINKQTMTLTYAGIPYFITWLDDLTGVKYVRLSLRRSLNAGECLNYCVVRSSN